MEKQVVAYAVSPQVLQATLNILGAMPYSQVAGVIPALQQSQPIYQDQVQPGAEQSPPGETPAAPVATP